MRSILQLILGARWTRFLCRQMKFCINSLGSAKSLVVISIIVQLLLQCQGITIACSVPRLNAWKEVLLSMPALDERQNFLKTGYSLSFLKENVRSNKQTKVLSFFSDCQRYNHLFLDQQFLKNTYRLDSPIDWFKILGIQLEDQF